jgi:paraquat-inducible protein B
LPLVLALSAALLATAAPLQAQDTPLPDAVDRALGRAGRAIGLGQDGPEGTAGTGVRAGVPFLVRFKGTVGGLEPGAPVRVRGMRMGAVREVTASFDPATGDFDIPVVIELDPAPFTAGGDPAAAGPAPVHEAVAALVRRGLRAKLGTGNLVTGETVVHLDDAPGAAPAELRRDGPVPEIPTVDVPFVSLQDAIARFLAGGGGGTTAALGRVAAEAEATLASARRLLDDPQLPALVAALARAGEGAAPLVAALGARAEPLAAGLEGVMRSAPGLANRASAALGQDGPAARRGRGLAGELEELLLQSANALRSVRALTELVERDPQAFLRGRSAAGGR